MATYATVADVLAYLDQLAASITPAEQAALGQMLDRASSIIDAAMLPVVFAPWPTSATVEWVTCVGGEYMDLPAHQPGSVSELRAAGTVVDPANYREIDGMLQITVETATFPIIWSRIAEPPEWTPGRYQVTAKWGYGPPPPSMAEMAIEMTINMWRSRANGMYQQVLGADDGAGLRYVGGLNSFQRTVIDNVRKQYIKVTF